MHSDIVTLAPNFDGTGLKIGIVVARFYEDDCHGLRDRCLDELIRLGVSPSDIVLLSVPGALEIPLALQNLAMMEEEGFDALIALGAVIRGETYHFELVSNESGSGVTRVGLDFDIPIANGILTTENDEQALARLDKARECAQCAVEMANLQRGLIEL